MELKQAMSVFVVSQLFKKLIVLFLAPQDNYADNIWSNKPCLDLGL